MPTDKKQILFKLIVKDLIKPAFKAEGFTTSGQTFRKQENGFVKMFNIQRDGRDPEVSSFLFNIGFFVSYVNTLGFADSLQPDKVGEPDCCYRTRISQLGYSYEKWFTVRGNTKFENIKPSVVKAVAVSVDLFRNINALHDLVSPPRKYKTQLSYKLNRTPKLKLGMGLTLIKLGDEKLGMKLYKQGYAEFVAWLREMKKIRDRDKFEDTFPEDRWNSLKKISKELHIPIKNKNYY